MDVPGLNGRAQSAADQARSRAREQIEQRAGELGASASGTADDLRAVADQLRSHGSDVPAWIAEEGARRVARVGTYLEGASGDQLLRDIEAVGRKRPWAVVARSREP